MPPATMRAAVLHALGQPLQIEDLPVPAPAAGEVLVRLEACGVCHTDLHACRGDWPAKPRLPLVPGHEGVGRVAALGAGVKSLAEGDRVGVPWLHRTCGCCDPCLTGAENFCPAQDCTGFTVPGCFAEYVRVPAPFAAPWPEAIDPAAGAPLLCAGLTTYKGLQESGVRAGEWVGVVGVGGLGHLAVRFARSRGLHVAALDTRADKRDLARRLGADLVADPTDPAALSDLVRRTGGLHAVLVTATSTDAFRPALGLLRRRGACVLLAVPPGDFPLPIFPVVLQGLTVRGSLVGTRKDLRECLHLAAAGGLLAEVESYPLGRVNDVLDRLGRGEVRGRAVLTLGGT